MSTIDIASGFAPTANVANSLNAANDGKISQILNAQDFMKLLITELTHQDPLEPMKNQDILNQITSIQELESNRRMSQSFTGLIGRLDDFVNSFDTLISREQMSAAGKMVGQLVAGITDDGESVFGKVHSVNVENGQVRLDLDTGQSISLEQLTRLGGPLDIIKDSDMIGKIVVGKDENDRQIIGSVESVEVGETDVILHVLETGSESGVPTQIPLATATVISESTADLMIGSNVKGNNGQDISGTVTGYKIDSEGIKLILKIEDGLDPVILPLSSVTEINPKQEQTVSEDV